MEENNEKIIEQNVSQNNETNEITSTNIININDINFETTPIVDIVNYILVAATKSNASDIHFDPAKDSLKVRLRIDGVLKTYLEVAKNNK